MTKFLVLFLITLGLQANATETTYDVEGMHCSACAKSIQSKLCNSETYEKCEVSVGKIIVAPKAGISISKEQIQQAISKAGEYKIIGEK
ncbi:hypothetical protein D3C87_1658280 [compost metagenome]